MAIKERVKKKRHTIRNFFILLFFIIILIIGTFIVDRFFLNSIIFDKAITIIAREEKDTFTTENQKSFQAVDIKGWLKPKDGNITDYSIVPIVYGKSVLDIPVPDGSDIRNTYYDTIFDNNGTFYIALSKTPCDFDKSSLSIHNLGYKRTVVIEVRFSNTNAVVYIQCYTPEILYFYENYTWSDDCVSESEYDLSLTNDDLASEVSFDPNLIPDVKDMYLDPSLVSIVNSYREDFEGYSDFYPTETGYFNYFRGIGFIDTKMRVEYAKLISMGFVPTEIGEYDGISYIKFGTDVILLGSPITKNSCFIYHVTGY